MNRLSFVNLLPVQYDAILRWFWKNSLTANTTLSVSTISGRTIDVLKTTATSIRAGVYHYKSHSNVVDCWSTTANHFRTNTKKKPFDTYRIYSIISDSNYKRILKLIKINYKRIR